MGETTCTSTMFRREPRRLSWLQTAATTDKILPVNAHTEGMFCLPNFVHRVGRVLLVAIVTVRRTFCPELFHVL